jgi:hypothetical protein
MPDPGVRSSLNHSMVLFQSDAAAPVFAQVHPGPNGEAQSCDRERQSGACYERGLGPLQPESAETKAPARRPSKRPRSQVGSCTRHLPAAFPFACWALSDERRPANKIVHQSLTWCTSQESQSMPSDALSISIAERIRCDYAVGPPK